MKKFIGMMFMLAIGSMLFMGGSQILQAEDPLLADCEEICMDPVETGECWCVYDACETIELYNCVAFRAHGNLCPLSPC